MDWPWAMPEVKFGLTRPGLETENGEVIESCRSGLNLTTSLSTRERGSEACECVVRSVFDDDGSPLCLTLRARDLQHALFNLTLNTQSVGYGIRRCLVGRRSCHGSGLTGG